MSTTYHTYKKHKSNTRKNTHKHIRKNKCKTHNKNKQKGGANIKPPHPAKTSTPQLPNVILHSQIPGPEVGLHERGYTYIPPPGTFRHTQAEINAEVKKLQKEEHIGLNKMNGFI